MWTRRAACAVAGVQPGTLRRWIENGFLGADPPWTVSELRAQTYRSQSAGRRTAKGDAPHGTLARYSRGCSCDLCRAASAERQRDRNKANVEAGLPAELRERILTLVSRGALLKEAAADAGVSTLKVLNGASRHPDWGQRLWAALDANRPAGWRHGHHNAIQRGCRCTECRHAQKAQRRGSLGK